MSALRLEGLLGRWVDVCSFYGIADSTCVDWWGKLSEAHTESHRTHHNLHRLQEMAFHFSAMEDRLESPKVLFFALMFHTAVFSSYRNVGKTSKKVIDLWREFVNDADGRLSQPFVDDVEALLRSTPAGFVPFIGRPPGQMMDEITSPSHGSHSRRDSRFQRSREGSLSVGLPSPMAGLPGFRSRLGSMFGDAADHRRASDSAMGTDLLSPGHMARMRSESLMELSAITEAPVVKYPDRDYFVDLILYMYGQRRERYASYTKELRHEFSDSPDENYRALRTEFLKKMLRLEPLYLTPYFRAEWGSSAQSNLRWELFLLRAASTTSKPLTIGDTSVVHSLENKYRYKDIHTQLNEEEITHALSMNFELCLGFRDTTSNELLASVITTRTSEDRYGLHLRTEHDFMGNHLLIHSLVVRKDLQRCGRGTALLKELRAALELGDFGITKVSLICDPQLQSFFEMNGFYSLGNVPMPVRSRSPSVMPLTPKASTFGISPVTAHLGGTSGMMTDFTTTVPDLQVTLGEDTSASGTVQKFDTTLGSVHMGQAGNSPQGAEDSPSTNKALGSPTHAQRDLSPTASDRAHSIDFSGDRGGSSPRGRSRGGNRTYFFFEMTMDL